MMVEMRFPCFASADPVVSLSWAQHSEVLVQFRVDQNLSPSIDPGLLHYLSVRRMLCPGTATQHD